MPHEADGHDPSPPAGIALEDDPILSAASFWTPTLLVASGWLGHAPFAAWLVDAIRPRTIVELGTYRGFSLFAFAEAVRRLGLDTRLTAIDSWQGDDHAGFYGEEVFRAVQELAERDHPERIRLLRGWFAEVVDEIPAGSVDLLHIDGRHGYEDARADFETYRDRLSPRGVVLFHDCFEFQEGFGVHRLWEELAPTAPSFRFEHAHGLGVLAVGPEVPPRLSAFLRAAAEDPARARATYAALGARVEDAAARQDRAAEADALRVRADAADRALADLRASRSWRITGPLRALADRMRGPG